MVPVESSHATSYLILTYILSRTFSEIWRIVGQIFAVDGGRGGAPVLNAIVPVSGLQSLA